MKAFATAFYNEKASVAAFTNYCIQEEWSIVVSFQKYRCQNRGTLVLKHTAPNCKLRICTFTPSGPFLGIGSGKVIKLNSRNNCLQVLVTKTWIAGCANKIWLIYRLRPLWRPLISSARNNWLKDYFWCPADRRLVVVTPWPAPVPTCHLVLHSTHTPPLPCPKIHNINWDLASQPVISPSNSGWNAPLMFPPPVQITDICPPDSSNSRVSFTFLLDDDL